jgi:hypothetical protein
MTHTSPRCLTFRRYQTGLGKYENPPCDTTMFSPMMSSNVVVSKSTAGTSRSRPAINLGTRILAMLSTVVLVYVLGDPMALISRDAA